MDKKIDLVRIGLALENIHCEGIPSNSGRTKIIEEAIELIQKNGETALMDGFLGMKNYAHFGDQRCDCDYGMGPKHGSVVFSVGRYRDIESNPVLGENEIYALVCLRDFGGVENPLSESGDHDAEWFLRRERFNLFDLINVSDYFDRKKKKIDEILLEIKEETEEVVRV